MQIIYSSVIGYLIGMLNPAYIIGRLRGFDIRNAGSGNAGASNAVITMGKAVGLFSTIFDILKSFAAVKICSFIFPQLRYAGVIAGSWAIIGHIFPAIMHFKGGKGLASLGGMILSAGWQWFAILLTYAILLALITDYLCFVPVTVSFIFAIGYGVVYKDLISALILAIAALIILSRHIENFKRIRLGMEAHFSMLWNKNREMERLKAQYRDMDAEEREKYSLAALSGNQDIVEEVLQKEKDEAIDAAKK